MTDEFDGPVSRDVATRSYSKSDLLELASQVAFRRGKLNPIDHPYHGIKCFPQNLPDDYMWKLGRYGRVDIFLPGEGDDAKFYRLAESRLGQERIDFSVEKPQARGDNVWHVLRAYDLLINGRNLD